MCPPETRVYICLVKWYTITQGLVKIEELAKQATSLKASLQSRSSKTQEHTLHYNTNRVCPIALSGRLGDVLVASSLCSTGSLSFFS